MATLPWVVAKIEEESAEAVDKKGKIKMINAKEAYDLSAPNLGKYRAFINERIREAASTGKLKIEIREDPYNMWLYGSDAVTKLAKKDACAAKVIRELKDLGYSVRQYYDDSSYFVDVALGISWEK